MTSEEERAKLAVLKPGLKIDRSAVSITHLTAESDEKEYWASRTPHERLEALEQMRQILYGYDQCTRGFQRVLEITRQTQR